MKPRCPDCDSTWIGVPVPDSACVVRDDDGRTTLAHAASGEFLHFDSCDGTHAICLDCRRQFDLSGVAR